MTGFSEIRKSLLKLYPFTEEQLDLLSDKLTYTNVKKGGFFLKINQISSTVAFVISGSLRHYTILEDDEVTLNFFTENLWVADPESFLTQKPSKNYIEAFEASYLALITLKDVHILMETYPSFRVLNSLIANFTIPASHLSIVHTKSPDKRYKSLLSKHPDWINRFPQMFIASYLGMTPETLSRVRARL